MIVSVTKKVSISCAHRLHSPLLSTDENKTMYGKCNNMHGHNYTISATWSGPVDHLGMVIDLSMVKQVMSDKIVAVLDHHCLDDDVEYFKTRPSTTENLGLFIAEQLMTVDYGTARLVQIQIHETDNNLLTVTL